MTLANYLQTPETVLPQELAFGTLHVADAPLVPHQQAVGRLFLAISAHLDAHPEGTVWLSPIDVILDANRALVVQPDLLVISDNRSSIVADRIYGAPDLVIEVLSPGPRVGSISHRLAWFARYGVRECWLVHVPDRRVEVLGFHDGRVTSGRMFDADDAIESAVLGGFDRTPASILVG